LLWFLFPGNNIHGSFTYPGSRSVTGAAGVRLCTFGANNNLTSVTNVGQASRLSWAYDAYDRVSAFTNADGYVLRYGYDANGNVTNLVYPGNRNVYYAFDSLNRLTNVLDWAGGQTRLTYDLASRLTSITRPNNTVRVINYDDDDEVTNIAEKTTTGFPIAFFTLGWTNSGRVGWEFAAPLPHSNSPPGRTMTYDDDNRIATFNGQSVAHDDDGNMTAGPLTNSTLATYVYDARNRLSALGDLQYGYDPSGSRTSITNGGTVTKFVINPNARLSQVLMRVRPDVTNYYIYGAGLLYEITETATTTTTLTHHFDYRGSTVALTDANGMPTDRMYSAYGLTTYRVGTNDTPFLYNGGYGVMTEANGLLYMRARYYNPYLCRFINPDPAGFAGGLNWYCFADGNPISLNDPFGLCPSDFNTGYGWLDSGIDMAAKAGEGALGLGAQAILKGSGAALQFADQALRQPSGALLMFLASRGTSGLLRTAATGERMAAARSATTLGETTYNVSFGSTGSGLLDSLGLQGAKISNIGVKIDPSLTGAQLVNTSAHESFHVAVAQNLPNFAASSGRLRFIGAFPLYAEEVGAYGLGAVRAGQYGQALLAPVSAFQSLSAGQSISVLGTGAAVGGLWYYNTH